MDRSVYEDAALKRKRKVFSTDRHQCPDDCQLDFKYNLISTITIITIKNYLATISSPYSNDPALIIENLRKESEPEGFPSIYNALTVSADYISILDKMNIDIVFFYSSQNSLDRGNIYDLIEFYSENKTEIHFFTFETPFELLYVSLLIIKLIIIILNRQ